MYYPQPYTTSQERLISGAFASAMHLMFLALLGVMIVDRLVARRPESAATWRKVGLGLTVASLLLSAMASFTICTPLRSVP